MTHDTRKSVSDDLRKWCHMAGEHASVEVCMWGNGEGFDFSLDSKPAISLTMGELDAVYALAAMIGKE